MQMVIKEVPATAFVYSSHTLKIPEIPSVAGTVISPLYQTVNEAGLQPAGPLHFLFWDCSGSHEEEFPFHVALPVNEEAASAGQFASRTAPPFKCAALDYKGSMTQIQDGYMALISQIRAAGLEVTNESREVYKHWVDYDSDDNVTELQIGLR